MKRTLLSSDGEGTPTYAGFWVRFCAVLIDSVVVIVGAGILGIIIGIAIALVSPDTLENPVFDILTGLGGNIGGAALRSKRRWGKWQWA